jgi:hypothetical protein
LFTAARDDVKDAGQSVCAPVFGNHVDRAEGVVHTIKHLSIAGDTRVRVSIASVDGEAHGVTPMRNPGAPSLAFRGFN